MEEATVTLAWALAAILVLAAVGKVLAPGGFADVLVAAAEGLLGLILLLGVYPLMTGVLVLAVGLAYLTYSLVRPADSECSCFGRRLPSSSVRVQRTRNTLMAAMALAYFLFVLGTGTHTVASVSIVFAGLGVLSGCVVVVAPWLVEWSFTA